MKSPILTCMALLAFLCTQAQFSLLPQIGFEQSRATLGYASTAASDVAANLRAALKADFRFKGGHGPFVQLSTSPAPTGFVFANDGTYNPGAKASSTNLQFRMEAGYQYSSKPISLKKAVARKSTTVASHYSMQRKTCGSSIYRPQCGDKNAGQKNATTKTLQMRLQPSLAVAYLSADNTAVRQRPDGFEYFADAWNTALVPALGVELGKGAQRLLTLTLFYTKPLDLQSQNVNALSGSKPVITALHPKASSWGLTVGVPISLTKKAAAQNVARPSAAPRPQVKHYYYKKCSRTVLL